MREIAGDNRTRAGPPSTGATRGDARPVARRACALKRTSRSTLRYDAVKPRQDAPVVAKMRELSGQYPRYRYRRIRVFLARTATTRAPPERTGSGSWRSCRCPRSAFDARAPYEGGAGRGRVLDDGGPRLTSRDAVPSAGQGDARERVPGGTGRRGRRSRSPPQLGQGPVAAHVGQNVHS